MTMKKPPLYQQIYDDMMNGIQNGTWKEGDLIPSEKDLAQQYNVSRITSKKALEMLSDGGYIIRMPGKGSFIQKLPPAVQENTYGSKDVQNRPLLIGLILPDFDETFGTGLLSGVEKAASEQGVFVIFRRSYDDQQKEEQSIDELLLLGVDGLIIMPVHGEHYAPKILRLIIDRFPVVFVDRHLRGLNAPFVGTDNVEAMKKATDYLLNIGHRRICFLAPPYTNTTAIEDRIEGFVKSHVEHGVPVDESIWLTDLTATLPGNNSSEVIQHDIDKIKNLLRDNKDITCIFVAEYNIALLAVVAVKKLGLHIPQDFSLITYDNPHNFMGEYTYTHILQRENEMAKNAVRLVLQQIRKENVPNEKIFLEADLMIGFSTKEVKK